MATKHILYTTGLTLYGKAVKDSTPWASDVTAITEDVAYAGVYPAITTAPHIYIQAGVSPADSDTYLFDCREQYYGSIDDGDLYFMRRVHKWDWENATTRDKLEALYNAQQEIDKFCFAGDKADSTQSLMFPRTRTAADGTVYEIGGVSTVPVDIDRGAYLICDALVGGRDPQIDFESLGVKSETLGGVRTEFESGRVPPEHVANLVSSASAWALIRPFLLISTTFRVEKG